MKPGPRILVLDTENAPNLAAVWGIHEQRVRYDDIAQEWFFICGQWRWLGAKKVNTVSVLDDMKRFSKDHTDDYHVVKTLRDVLNEADAVIGHHVSGHDIKKLMAKIIEYKLKPVDMPIIIDTYTWVKKFGFTSRKLSDLCKKLGLTQKLSHEPGLFLKAALGDKRAIKDILKYGIGDIPTVEELYLAVRPYAHNHPNMNLFRGDGVQCCPHCGCEEFIQRGFRYNRTSKAQKYQCAADDCGRWFSDVRSIKKVALK